MKIAILSDFFYYLALLGITPATNNGTFGALYNLLKPDVVEKLPKGWINIHISVVSYII